MDEFPEYAEHTLRSIKQLWEKKVILETTLHGKKSLLRLVGESLKIERRYNLLSITFL